MRKSGVRFPVGKLTLLNCLWSRCFWVVLESEFSWYGAYNARNSRVGLYLIGVVVKKKKYITVHGIIPKH